MSLPGNFAQNLKVTEISELENSTITNLPSLSHCTTKLNEIHSNYYMLTMHVWWLRGLLAVVVGELGSVSPASKFVRVVQLVCCCHGDLFFIQCTADCPEL